jgi:hypothetical protein
LDFSSNHFGRGGAQAGGADMKLSFKLSISVAVAISFGLIVLLGYFIDVPLMITLRAIFLHYAAILAAIALMVGVVNLFSVHWRKVTNGHQGAVYSTILLIAFVATLLVVGYFGPTGAWSMWIFNNIETSIETSLMALLVILLSYATIRLVRNRMNLFTLVFTGSALLVLLGSAPLFGVELPLLYGPNSLRSLISQIPATAGARGILLGVALGTIATGLRILMGADRPYGG